MGSIRNTRWGYTKGAVEIEMEETEQERDADERTKSNERNTVNELHRHTTTQSKRDKKGNNKRLDTFTVEPKKDTREIQQRKRRGTLKQRRRAHTERKEGERKMTSDRKRKLTSDGKRKMTSDRNKRMSIEYLQRGVAKKEGQCTNKEWLMPGRDGRRCNVGVLDQPAL